MLSPTSALETALAPGALAPDGAQASARPGPGSRARRIPGELGIWLFIFGDMIMFALFFGTFVYERNEHRAVFAAGRHSMDVSLGALNTVLLLTGSLFVVAGLHAFRRGDRRLAPRWLLMAMACAAAFCVVKVFEWTAQVHHGHTLMSDSFHMYYFMFTGVHLLHVLIGIVALSWMYRVSRRENPGPIQHRQMEVCASYWHLVDLLWIVLFALLYLMR
jgi:nitric oxide reductase NorE protein